MNQDKDRDRITHPANLQRSEPELANASDAARAGPPESPQRKAGRYAALTLWPGP